MQIYGESYVLDSVRRNMPYCFGKDLYPGVPIITLKEVVENQSFYVGKTLVEPLAADVRGESKKEVLSNFVRFC